MHRDKATKRFHAGGDAFADLIDETSPAQCATPDTDVPMCQPVGSGSPLDTFKRVRAAGDARGSG